MRPCLEAKDKLPGACEFTHVLPLCFPDFHLTPPQFAHFFSMYAQMS